MSDLLLLHGTVVTVDDDRRIIEDGAVAIGGNRIAEVGTAADLAPRYPRHQIIDCHGKMVIPGLVDAHGHAGHSLIKTLATDAGSGWMKIVTPIYYHYTTREFWRVDGRVSALERLRAGVTTGASIIASMPRSDDPEFGIGHAKSYAEVGIREILCVGPAGLPWPHPVTRWENGRPERLNVSFEELLAGAEAVIEASHGSANGRIQVFLTPFTIVPSVDPSNPSTPDKATKLTAEDRMQARRVRDTARKWGVRIHSDAFAGQVRMAFQDKENALLGPDVHLQHCIDLSHEEVDILAETGTHMTHSPGGRSPILDMISKGVNVAVTSDGTSPRRPFDMLMVARTAQQAQQTIHRDQYILPPGKMLEMITIDAARALGLEAEIGSLEAGKKADVAILDMRQPHLAPNWMPVHRLIYQANGADVTTVIVDGEVLMADRKVLSVNLDDVVDEAEHEARALVERAGLDSYLFDPGWGMLSRSFVEPIATPRPPEV